MLSTSSLWGRATHTTDPSSGRQCVHTRLTADLNAPHYSASYEQIQSDSCTLNSCYEQHRTCLIKIKGVTEDGTKDHTHTCQVRVCNVRRGLVWSQEAPSWWGRPGRRRARRSWLKGFCRAALCHLLQETDCSGSLGSSQVWRKTQRGWWLTKRQTNRPQSGETAAGTQETIYLHEARNTLQKKGFS